MSRITRVIIRLLEVLINKQIITEDDAKYILRPYEHPYEVEEDE